ncbi:HEAT repeat domain-containing protein [Dinoroseobacter sp. S76]|uniref:HEAT repeat domain-containing protein n=1 Tax=Dinoroseobacter sp. S76 TaxID=3415124 RepID=UPI003C79B8CD
MRDLPMAPMPAETAATLATHIQSDNEIIRSAAIKALAGLGVAPALSLPLLTDALMDPDPDVRTDAMDALSRCALPEHTELLVFSLEGDPVREVKRAALSGLARLRATSALDLIRALTLSRSEDRVAWEDENSDWEDWLDIQIAAIEALGEMRATEAIEDLMAARDDELGQTLDIPVFDALAKIGHDGVVWLLAILETEGGPARRRALTKLCQLDPALLVDHLDRLIASPDAQLRAHVVGQMDPDDTRLAQLAAEDPAASVRIGALQRVATEQPEKAIAALQDPAPEVQAAALDLIPAQLDPELSTSLEDNMLAWLAQGPAVLVRATARHLPRRAPERAEAPLLALIADPQRPLDARVSAVKSLATMEPAIETTRLVDLLGNPAQQIRTTVLVALTTRAQAGDLEAGDAIRAAIQGTLLSDDVSQATAAPLADGPDMTVPKEGESGPRRIRISPEGEIIEDTPEAVASTSSHSTLTAILAPMEAEPELAEDTPEEAPSKRRRRRAVEGADGVAEALVTEAIKICGTARMNGMTAALLAARPEAPDTAQQAIWTALAQTSPDPDCAEALLSAAHKAHGHEDPVIRAAAYAVLAKLAPDSPCLAAALEDPDALIRAAAIRRLPPEDALAYLGDGAMAVRHGAVDVILTEGSDAAQRQMAERIASAERADTLAYALAQSEPARRWFYDRLSTPDLGDRAVFILLDAAGQMAPAA